MQIKPPPEKNARRSKRFENDENKTEVSALYSYSIYLSRHIFKYIKNAFYINSPLFTFLPQSLQIPLQQIIIPVYCL